LPPSPPPPSPSPVRTVAYTVAGAPPPPKAPVGTAAGAPPPPPSRSDPTGVIIGVIIGVIVGVIIAIALVILHRRRRDMRRKETQILPVQDAESEGMECSFWFVEADSLRRAAKPNLPMMQTLRTQEPHRLVQITISFIEGIKGAYTNILVVSHRWETPTDPDPTGEQALVVQAYLKAHPEIDSVWFDFSSMPQGKNKTQSEKAEFKEMLPNINLLYLTCSVLILMDRSYMNRFWTQFEAYLSMRAISSQGLTNAQDPMARVTIETLRGLPASQGTVLMEEWSNKTPDEAHAILAGQDVIVTNQSDKVIQLAKLKVLNERLRLPLMASDCS